MIKLEEIVLLSSILVISYLTIRIPLLRLFRCIDLSLFPFSSLSCLLRSPMLSALHPSPLFDLFLSFYWIINAIFALNITGANNLHGENWQRLKLHMANFVIGKKLMEP